MRYFGNVELIPQSIKVMKLFFGNTFNTIKNQLIRSRTQQNPVYILQMGRVGSTSVLTAIGQAYQEIQRNIPIYHSHYISNYDKVIGRACQDLANPNLAIESIQRGDSTANLLMRSKNKQPIKIISLVRDPVARNISAFFFAFSQFVPDWKEKEAQNLLPANTLNTLFESKRQFIQTAFNWFDEQIKDTIGLDVYAVPFDTAQGWQVYQQGQVKLLLLRMEDLHRTGEDALRKFLHLPNLKMVKVNTGEEKEAYQLYRRFLTHPISQEYLEMTYSTKLARHFYTEAEIKQFIQRWRSSP